MNEASTNSPNDLIALVHQRIAPLLPAGYRVVLFGSWAKGTATPRSDLDIAIDGPQAIERTLWTKILNIIEELPTLRKIDCVDTHQVGERLRQEILTTGKELVYE